MAFSTNINLATAAQNLLTQVQNDSSNAPISTNQAQIEQNNQINNFQGSGQNPNDVIDQRAAEMSQSGVMTFPHDRPKYYFMMEIATYSRQNLISIGELSYHTTIILPLPPAIVDRHEERWDQVPLGVIVGGIANQGIDAGRDLAASFKSDTLVGPERAKQIAAAGAKLGAAVVGGAAAIGAQGVAAAAPINQIGNAVQALVQPGLNILQSIAGIAPNQFMTILYSGPRYKIFNLHWKLAPKSYAEATTLREMANKINNAAAPELFAGGFIFKFPDIFQLSFKPNAGFLYKFKPAVVINCTINRAPGGIPAFYKGQQNPPESLELSITFMELEYWLKGNYNSSDEARETYTGPSEQFNPGAAPHVPDAPQAGVGGGQGGSGIDDRGIPNNGNVSP